MVNTLVRLRQISNAVKLGNLPATLKPYPCGEGELLSLRFDENKELLSLL
jgi:hypothetical protein